MVSVLLELLLRGQVCLLTQPTTYLTFSSAFLPKRKIRHLYTTLRKFIEVLEYLENLFLPLLLMSDALVVLPHHLHPAQMPFLVVH
jgi:hypothetical protein